MSQSRLSSYWVSYAVAIALGVSFSLTLFYLALQKELNDVTSEFEFEAMSLGNSVSRSVSSGDDVARNIAVLFESLAAVDEQAFVGFTRPLLERSPFIGSVAYHRIDHGLMSSLSTEHVLGRDADIQPRIPDLKEPQFQDLIETAVTAGTGLPSPLLPGEPGQADRYYLIQPVFDAESGMITGLVSVSMLPELMLANVRPSSSADLSLFSESESLLGRQALYNRNVAGEKQSSATGLKQLFSESLTQFPLYTMKLQIQRQVYWTDLDLALMFTSLLLGLGLTLLMIALVRAREQQAQELLERNLVIEEKVRQQTRELAEARDEAIHASHVKSEFLASMSHEIRTPLNAIIGMAELLSETRLSNDQDKYVNVFRRAGEALLSLVNDILDLSKIEAGQLDLESIEFDLNDLLEQALEIYALKTDEKGIELLCHIAPDVPVHLKGDPARLRQIILNLIGNAIKFTEEGEIVVRVAVEALNDSRQKLHFMVADTGIGIPADKLELIFGSFSQVDSSTTRKYGGTGLGLTISRKLVEKMNGRIWVESEEGRGSEFHFIAEFGEADQALQDPHATQERNDVSLAGLSVLVVDDNETNRLILNQVLTPRGARVTEAADGEQGLELYRSAQQSGSPYGLVLLDCRMPGIDGFQVAESIRDGDGDVDTVMMLTSSNLSSHLNRARDIGMAAYLVKPVKQADLLKSINEALSRKQTVSSETVPQAAEASEPVATEAVAADNGSPTRILLVEDTADNRMLIKAYLKKLDCELDEAENGQEAVDRFKQTDYDLVLMDVQMPVMDGHEATRVIRSWERSQGREPTPILALTAHAIQEEMDKSLAAGCTAHLTKPIKKSTLIEAIASYTDSPSASVTGG